MIRSAFLGLTLSFTALVLAPGQASAQYPVHGAYSSNPYATSPDNNTGYCWRPVYALLYYSNFVSLGIYSPVWAYSYLTPIYSTYYATRIPWGTAYSSNAPAITAVAYTTSDKSPSYAFVKVLLPTADAEVWLNGSMGKQQGNERVFKSPGLELGRDYFYTIRARWMVDGRPVESIREVDIRAGQTSTVDFRIPASEGMPSSPKVK